MNNSPTPLTLRSILSSLRYLLFLLLFCSVSFSLSANNNTDPIRLQYSQFDQFIQQQQGQQALQIVQQMMQSAPSHPLTGVAQARINLIRNNLAEAQLILNQVLNAYPHQPEATAFLAELENYQGQKQNALRRIDLALQQHPDADLLASMALRILAQPQDAQQRIPYLQRLANSGSDAERAQAYASIGETYMTLKQASAAADALRQSLELQLNANVAYAFVQQLVVAGRYGEALAYAALLRADFPQAQANALEQAWAAELQQALAAMTRTVAPVPNVSKVSAADRTELESIINQVTVQPRLNTLLVMPGSWIGHDGRYQAGIGQTTNALLAIARAGLTQAKLGRLAEAMQITQSISERGLRIMTQFRIAHTLAARGEVELARQWYQLAAVALGTNWRDTFPQGTYSALLDRAASDVNSIGIMVQLDWMLYERMKEHSRFLAENYDEFIALNAMKYATLYLLEGESARTALNAQLNLSSTAIFRAASRLKQFDFAYTLWSPSSVEPSDALNALGEFLNAGRQREAEIMTRQQWQFYQQQLTKDVGDLGIIWEAEFGQDMYWLNMHANYHWRNGQKALAQEIYAFLDNLPHYREKVTRFDDEAQVLDDTALAQALLAIQEDPTQLEEREISDVLWELHLRRRTADIVQVLSRLESMPTVRYWQSEWLLREFADGGFSPSEANQMIEYYVSAAPSVIATLDEAGRSSRYSEMVYWLTRYQRSQEVQQLLAETSAQIPQMIMLDSLHVALLERYDL